MAGLAGAGRRTPDQERRRLSLLLKVAASAGDFSPKLAESVGRATGEEVRVLSDLLDRGLSIPEMVSVLHGAHVVIGDDSLYERWIFPTSHRRMSSHHRSVDKGATPDYGLDGPLVRESLHGKAPVGTWMQLERTRATFRWGTVPSWSDLIHIRDYLIYRITGENVGPWGLSRHVDTRPMMLRPPNTTPGRAAEHGLAAFAQRRSTSSVTAGQAAHWADVFTANVTPVGPAGDLFGPPEVSYARELLPDAPYKDELGTGLFGSLSLVHVRVALRPEIAADLDAAPPPAITEPTEGLAETRTLSLGRSTITLRAAAAADHEPPGVHRDGGGPRMTTPDALRDQQLADIAELVETGPVDLGAYTQAELAVVLGEVPALAGIEDVVLAEAVRSLAARGLLFHEPGQEFVDIVGDIGLVVALVAMRTSTLEIRRGHDGAPDQPWRWGLSLLPMRVVGLDRVDALGLHRLALMSVEGVADVVVERLIDGRARIPGGVAAPVASATAQLRQLAEGASSRWQLIHRVPRPDGTQLVVDALVLRTGQERVDLVTRAPDGEGYRRTPVDAAALREFLVGLAAIR